MQTSSVTMDVYISLLPVDVSGDMELVELVNLGQLRTRCKYHEVAIPISPCTPSAENQSDASSRKEGMAATYRVTDGITHVLYERHHATPFIFKERRWAQRGK